MTLEPEPELDPNRPSGLTPKAGAPTEVREHRVVFKRGERTYPDGVRPWLRHWEAGELGKPGDLFATEDLADVSLILHEGPGGCFIVRRFGLVGQPEAVRHEDGTLSIGPRIERKTVMTRQVTDCFRIERGRVVYL